jgi:hypothetical protein
MIKKYKCKKSNKDFIKNEIYNGYKYSLNGKDIIGYVIYNNKINKYNNKFILADFYKLNDFQHYFIDIIELRKRKIKKLINNSV